MKSGPSPHRRLASSIACALAGFIAFAATPSVAGGRGGASGFPAIRVPIDAEVTTDAQVPVGHPASAYRTAGTTTTQSIGNVRVNDPAQTPAGAPDLTPAVAVLGNQVLVVWSVRGTAVTERLRAAFSDDGGVTFTDAGWLPALPTNWRWGADPCVDADPVTHTFFIAAQTANPTEFKQGIAFITAQVDGAIYWGTPSIVRELAYGGSYFGDQLSMKYDLDHNWLDLVFHDGIANPNTLTHQTSYDRGVTWQPPTVLFTDPTGLLGIAPRIAHDPYLGPVVMYLDAVAASEGARRVKRYLSPGVFAAPVTLGTQRIEPGTLPGTLADAVSGSSISVDHTIYRYQNRIYAAWVASASFQTWPTPSGVHVTETEPNDIPGQANPLASGVGWYAGTFAPASDADCVSITLQANQHLVVRATQMTNAGIPNLEAGVVVQVIAPDGTHGLGATVLVEPEMATANVLYTAPRSATYTLKLSGVNVTSYEVSLSLTNASTYPALDRRDIYTSYSTNGGQAWTAPAMVYTSPAGFDVADVVVTVGNDGRPYLFWLDFSEGHPDGAFSGLRSTRSNDGGQTWEAPRTISTALSDWQPVVAVGTNYKIGWRMGAATTPVSNIGELKATAPNSPNRTTDAQPGERMCVVWPDARDGQGNIYAASFPTAFEVLYRSLDTVATPGQWLALHMVLQNRNTLFPLRLEPEAPACTRNWESFQNPFTIDPGATTSTYPFLVHVPDTAAVGTVFFQGGFNEGPNSFGLNTFIHVLPAVGVAGTGAIPLAFSAPSPNPMRSIASFGYSLPTASDVSLELFDVGGARVRTLVVGRREAGTHEARWDLHDDSGRSVPAGVYLSRLTVGAWSRTRRVAVIR